MSIQFLPLWLLLPLVAGAQNPVSRPLFALRADSLEYARVRTALFENPKLARHERDSLMVRFEYLTRQITGYRTDYRPRFPSPDSLAQNPGLTAISVVGRSVTRLPARVWEATQLQELELIDTRIRKLPRKLNRLTHLRVIYVFNPDVRQPIKLSRNDHVQELFFRSDHEKSLPTRYRPFRALQQLDLSATQATRFPSGIHRNTRLQKLKLNSNRISLQTIGKGSGHLRELELVGNQLKEVPDAIAQLPGLQRLILANNQIATVSSRIATLQQLREVSFYKNQLTHIPEGLFALQNLRQIDLYYNQIEQIPASIQRWQNLEILYLSFNRIFALPSELGQLTRLRELYLSNNRLSELPRSLAHLPSLHVLRVNQNYLPDVPAAVYQLTTLENIDLSHNRIMSIEERLFDRTGLKIFALVGNPWEADVKSQLPSWAARLRAKGTVVHLNTFEDAVEDP